MTFSHCLHLSIYPLIRPFVCLSVNYLYVIQFSHFVSSLDGTFSQSHSLSFSLLSFCISVNLSLTIIYFYFCLFHSELLLSLSLSLSLSFFLCLFFVLFSPFKYSYGVSLFQRLHSPNLSVSFYTYAIA